MILYGNLIVYSTDNMSEHCCQTRNISAPININDNISCMWICCVVFLFTVNRNEDIVRESHRFSFKIFFMFYVIIYHLTWVQKIFFLQFYQ